MTRAATVNVKVVDIIWNGPYPIEIAAQMYGDTDYGLYQIYGTHSVCGPDTLLYVGQADASHFGDRLGEKLRDWAPWEPDPLIVYVGRLGGWDQLSDEEWGELIDKCEAITIFATAPPYNSHRVKELVECARREPLFIINSKRRHRLPMYLSNMDHLYPIDEGNFATYGSSGVQPKAPPGAP